MPVLTTVQRTPAALLLGSDPYLYGGRKQQIELAVHQSIPTMFSGRAAASDGGLMSYSINFADGYRQAATYVARVLKGEKPGELPVVLRPTKFKSENCQDTGVDHTVQCHDHRRRGD